MVDWTFDAAEVTWMTERLKGFWDRRLAAIAPTGFSAYGRLFHPARDESDRPVRWAEVAAHHGLPMSGTSDFPYLALPESLPDDRSFWTGDSPETGTLDTADTDRLLTLLEPYTSTPEAITFALWDGLGWDHTVAMSSAQGPPTPVPDVIPAAVRRGPRMRIPGRDYLVYRGNLADVRLWMPTHRQTPHYWWPRDHAWAICGDVDLSWTIVAGSIPMLDTLAQDERLEVLPIDEAACLDGEPPWLTRRIVRASRELLDRGSALIQTSRGTVRFGISDNGQWLVSDHGRRRLNWNPGRIPLSHDAVAADLSTMLLNELRLT